MRGLRPFALAIGAAATLFVVTATPRPDAVAPPASVVDGATEAIAAPHSEAIAAPPTEAIAMPPTEAVPPCTFDARTLALDPTADTATALLDTAWRLPAGYAPPDLVDVAAAGFAGGFLVRRVVIDDLAALRRAAEAAGVRLAIQSAYRSEAYQEGVHRRWVEALGAERAREVSARPGHSEHQLGTALDLRSADGPPAWDLADWAATPEGAWIASHAAAFGFVISYPAGERARSCYDYEPWHLRWVGRDLAASVAAEGVPLRVHLHRHHPPEEASTR